MEALIETDRCDLTHLHADDEASFVQVHLDEDVRRYLGGAKDEAATRLGFAGLVQAMPVDGFWVVRLKENGAFMGIISLGLHHDGVDTEISYQFLPVFWGQGYATETVKAVVDYAFDSLKLQRVIAEIQTANRASCRLLEQLGMCLERMVERFGAEQAIYVMDAELRGGCGASGRPRRWSHQMRRWLTTAFSWTAGDRGH